MFTESASTPRAITGSRRRRVNRAASLIILLACGVATMGYAASNRTVLASDSPRPARTGESLTFQAVIDSAAGMEARYGGEIRMIPEHDDKRRLHSTIDYLRRVTYLYYDWAIGGAASVSGDAITREYLRPAVESILEARPALAEGREGLPSEVIVRLYFLDHNLFLADGVVYAPDGLGRFPSLELLPIVKETPLDAVVWGRHMDAVAFAVRGSFIFDIVSYSRGESTGPNMVTMNTIVCHHLDREADFVRAVRHDMQRARRGIPSLAFVDADAMGQGLAYLALQPYLPLDEEGAVASFVEDWSETSYIHELGHMFSKQAELGLVPQTGEEEAVAFLTELRFGGMPHYTLYNMYKVGVVQGIHPHKDGMKLVYADFARQIRAAKQRGDGFDAFDVGADAVEVDVLEGIIYQFPKLRSEEIRALADRVFEEKYRARVKE